MYYVNASLRFTLLNNVYRFFVEDFFLSSLPGGSGAGSAGDSPCAAGADCDATRVG